MIYLSLEEVIAIHDTLVKNFGGIFGIRDKSLLESAIATPMTAVFGQEMYPTAFDKAAAYIFSISRNHPFLDGNKRTATFSCFTFLEANGQTLTYNENEVLEFVVSVAEGKIEKEQISLYLKNLCLSKVETSES